MTQKQSPKPRKHHRKAHKPQQKHKTHHNSGLPDAATLQEYEYASEGAAKTILEMAKKEQANRHQQEESYGRFYKKTQRISQLFGFVVMLYSVHIANVWVSAGQFEAAKYLIAVVFGSYVLVGLLHALLQRKKKSRPNRSYQRKRSRS